MRLPVKADESLNRDPLLQREGDDQKILETVRAAQIEQRDHCSRRRIALITVGSRIRQTHRNHESLNSDLLKARLKNSKKKLKKSLSIPRVFRYRGIRATNALVSSFKKSLKK
jgi:hypothetical protein